MAKWKVTFTPDSGVGAMTIEADEVSWPYIEVPARGGVQFANRLEPAKREERPNVTLVTDFELVAFVNTQYVVAVERVADEG